MKNVNLFLLLNLLCLSCEPQYDGETKLFISGNVTNESGTPLSNQKINITAFTERFPSGSNSQLISQGNTDQNGNFLLAFSKPVDAQIEIEINNQTESDYLSKTIIIDEKNFKNFRFNSNSQILFKKNNITTLKILINQVNADIRLESLKIAALQPNNFENLTSPIANNFDFFNAGTIFSVLKNQVITIQYKVIQNGLITSLTTIVPVNDAPVIYTLNI